MVMVKNKYEGDDDGGMRIRTEKVAVDVDFWSGWLLFLSVCETFLGTNALFFLLYCCYRVLVGDAMTVLFFSIFC